MEILNFKLIKIKEEIAGVKTFRFLPDKKFDFKPGQFINVYLKDGEKLEWRAYSISSSPTEKYVEITVKILHSGFSAKLANLQVESEVEVRGPFGGILNFTDSEDVVVIAGGIGITPFMSGLRYINEKILKNKVSLFYCCKTIDQILFSKELHSIAEKNSNINLVCTLTREVKNWHGEKGRINSKMIKKHLQNYENKAYFICGPQEMVDQLIVMLKNLGVSEKNIRKEAWG